MLVNCAFNASCSAVKLIQFLFYSFHLPQERPCHRKLYCIEQHMLQQTPTHTSTQSWRVNHRVYQCLSSGRGDKMTNKTSGTQSAAVTGAWQEMLESLTPSEGWGAGGLIRTSCHLWRRPWQTWEWFWESQRSGTSWQSDPGPVAAALAMQR